MDIQNRSKLNRLLLNWPRGSVFTQAELTHQAISRQLVATYQKSSWLKRIGHGAFIRADDTVDWLGAVFAMQQQLALSVHPAGKTALQLQGYAHFVPLGDHYPVWLLGSPKERLPDWFKTHEWGVDVSYHASKLFSDSFELGLQDYNLDSFTIKIASPERAMFELLAFVPLEQSFSEAKLLMEGLTTLRPKLVQALLEACHFIKVKRLFLYLAECCEHGWLQKLLLDRVDLGSGKRVIVSGGKLDPKYLITVPRE